MLIILITFAVLSALCATLLLCALRLGAITEREL